jgi:hypothetical protein
MRKALKWTGVAIGGIVLLAIIVAAGVVLTGAILFDRMAARAVPAGYPRNSSVYVAATDGTKVAIDVWLPEMLKAGERVPALMKPTPYWRARRLTLLGKAFAYFLAPSLAIEPEVPLLNARGYAVIGIDARGTGASFGTLKTMFSDAEVADYGSVADWIAKQPWSDGKVGAYGFSYRGISAANIASLPNREIKAVAPLFDLSDLYLLGYPGGTFAQYLLTAWSAQTRLLNNGIVPCDGDTLCEMAIAGPKPVDADTDGALLRQAIAAHAANYNVHDCARAAPARNDRICASGQSLSENSLLARKAEVEARGLPIFALTGWLDESSPGQVLNRFVTFSNPQEVVLGPFTHGGFMGDDPFAPDAPMAMTYGQQMRLMADFFDRTLRDGKPIHNSVHYYVIGASVWRDSPSWPPAGSALQKWYPDRAHTLSQTAADGTDTYKVDFNASTGTLSGYRGQVDLSKTDYGDRAKPDAHLLSYTSAPMGSDMEIAGNPVAHLHLATSATGGLVIVYLEDVAPNGRVTYITQGLLNLAHRKTAAPGGAVSADPLHSYLRTDMAPMRPGVGEDIAVAISPIAALIRKGHALRVAIAGADAGNLERLPATGNATLTLTRGAVTYVEVPVAR